MPIDSVPEVLPTAVHDRLISGAAAWTAETLRTESWHFPLPEAALAEIRRLATWLDRNRLPFLLLNQDDYDLPACRAVMERVRFALLEGVRFAVVDRLPLDEIGDEAGRQVYWLLSNMVARTVAQKLDGTMFYDVRDYGIPATPGSGIRPAQTNKDFAFHNDNAWNTTMPEVVGLLCLRQAKSGGVSRTISFATVHNRLLEQRPDLLRLLYEPYEFDRQKEFWPDESPFFRAPIFRYDTSLSVRLSSHQILGAFALRRQEVPERMTEAFRWLDELCDSASLSVDFRMERGVIQYVNNRQIGHARTEFVEFDDPALRRHLLRLWMRQNGARSYTGM
jgi:hypothetical protein